MPWATIERDGGAFDLLTVHFDDGEASNRLRQGEDLARLVMSGVEPVLVAGGINSIDRKANLSTRLLATGLARRFAERKQPLMPRTDYEEEHGRPHQITRLAEMIDDGLPEILGKAGLVPVGTSGKTPTFKTTMPLLPLDGMLSKGDIRVSDFTRIDLGVRGVSHFAMRATVE